MKKFYKLVSTAPKESGHAIFLDGKPVRTPGGRILLAPAAPLVALIAGEWSAQGDDILPDTMPLTQLLVTALDRVESARDSIQAEALGYLDTDLLCYRAAEPEELVRRESAARDPWRQWFENRYGVKLRTTTGLIALRQDEAVHRQAEAAVRALDLWAFNVLQVVTSATGSLILALAFVAGDAREDDLMRALYVEEDHKAAVYNEEFYGRAPHQEKSMQAVARDLKAGREFLEALEPKEG